MPDTLTPSLNHVKQQRSSSLKVWTYLNRDQYSSRVSIADHAVSLSIANVATPHGTPGTGLWATTEVKCDRGRPCTECVRFNKQCLYENDQESSSSSRESHDELTDRIARLEALLQQQPNGSAEAITQVHQPSTTSIGISRATFSALKLRVNGPPAGFLTINDSLSSYVDSGFWGKLFEQSEDLYKLLEGETPSATPPDDTILGGHDVSSPMLNVSQFAPDPEQSVKLLDLFFERIEPFIGILHEPTFRRDSQLWNLGGVPHITEFGALLSAVYALTVHILPPETVSSIFPSSAKSTVGDRFCAAARAGLALASIMKTRSLLTFQALLYWATCLYERGEAESADGAVGIANQLARRLGLHKDPSTLNVPPFQAELRCRAWNHLVYLNTRPHVFEGMDVWPVLEHSSNFFPASIHDADWQNWLQARLQPVPEASNRRPKFPILRRQFASLTCFLLQLTPQLCIADADDILASVQAQLLDTYYETFDRSQVLQKFEALCVRLWVERLILSLDVAHLKAGRKHGDAFKNELYDKALSLLALVSRAETAAAAFGWAWLFRTDPEFLAISVVLCQVINRVEKLSREQVAQGWRSIEEFSQRHDNDDFSLRRTGAWRIIDHYKQQAGRRIQSAELLASSTAAMASAGMNDQWMSNAFDLDVAETMNHY